MAEEFEITEEMRSLIGKESPPWTYELTTTSVRGFARGVVTSSPVTDPRPGAGRPGW